MPLILRPTSRTGHFKLVGECYIHGIMRGEAVQMMKEGQYAVEDVTVV